MMSETLYEVLEVDEDASQDEITEAYRQMVKEYHPDVSDKPNAAEKFKKVVQAEEVLADPDEREKYDRMGHEKYMRQVEGDNVSGNEQSPWTSEDRRDRTHDDAGFGFGYDDSPGGSGGTTTSSGGTSSSGGATAHTSANSSVGFGKAAGRQASAGWTTGKTNNRWDTSEYAETETTETGPGQAADATPPGDSYSVHDWDDADAGPDTVTISITQEMAVMGVLMFLLYPVFVWFSLNPAFPLVLNFVVGLCTFLAVGYFLTLPKLGVGIFGTWSVISPVAVVVLTDWGLGITLLAISAFWVPFAYSVMVAYVTRPG